MFEENEKIQENGSKCSINVIIMQQFESNELQTSDVNLPVFICCGLVRCLYHEIQNLNSRIVFVHSYIGS